MTTATGRSERPVITIGHRVLPVQNVRTARVLALLLDVVLIAMLMVAAAAVILILGLLTFGIGWLLYFVLWPAVALIYYFFTLGINGRTLGMSIFGIELRDEDGGRPHPVIGLAHPVLFYISLSIFPLFIISAVISLMDEKKRMLHDIVLRVVMVRGNPALPD